MQTYAGENRGMIQILPMYMIIVWLTGLSSLIRASQPCWKPSECGDGSKLTVLSAITVQTHAELSRGDITNENSHARTTKYDQVLLISTDEGAIYQAARLLGHGQHFNTYLDSMSFRVRMF